MEHHQSDREHLVKRVVLPSGKTIEVVYFGEADEAMAAPRTAPDRSGDLHVCIECGSHLAYPTGWEESGSDHWWVTIRCPECETYREGEFTQGAVEAFDEELDAGTDALMADYRRLMRANMAEEVDRFAGALRSDAVLPEDF